jgi:phosphatidate cytidylyltransferase
MLAQRLLTSAIGIPLIAGVILLGGPVYDAVAALILVVAAVEFCAMVAPGTSGSGGFSLAWRPRPIDLMAAGGVVLIVILIGETDDSWTGPLAAGVALAMTALIWRGAAGVRGPLFALAGALLYVGLLGAHLVLLRNLDGDGSWVFLPILATWATDTFAYAAGRTFGRRRIAPRISPGKTLEGTAAGLAGGLASVVVLAEVLGLPISFAEAALLGAILPAAAVLGDLAESSLKRGAGVKDTSELVPGHGGLLDRLDSLLFTVPLVYYFAIWVVF